MKWQCLKMCFFFADEEATVHVINSYVLNEQSRNLLTFDTGYKAKFIDFLKRQGYDIFEKAKVAAFRFGCGACA